MEYRPLGLTGLRVSAISFGCVELGIPYGIGVRRPEDMLPEAEAIALLRGALERGITFFDTAPAYGASERLLGQAFAGIRDRVVLCTKCPRLTDGDGNVLPPRALRERLCASVESSCHALGTDVIDVLMLHHAEERVILGDEAAVAFAELKRQGLIRASGVSTYPGGMTPTVLGSGRWDVIQVAINLMDQRDVAHLEAAAAAGVGVIARSVLLKGVLTDRGGALHPALQRIQEHRDRCCAALPPGLDLAAFATRFVLGLPGVSSVVLGIDRRAYLDAALEAARGGALPPELQRSARELAFEDPAFIDLHRWHVRGWLT
ncbi:MAG: aldo/keto reductase [Lentisphaeria bacterium]|nr:aldo/keto reductase [Lentisphaeria bacterium]